MYLLERDTIVSPIRVVGVLHSDIGKPLRNFSCHISKRIVQTRIANIKDLSTHARERRVQNAQESFSHIIYMNERPPLLAVVNRDDVVTTGLCGQEVYNQIKAGAG